MRRAMLGGLLVFSCSLGCDPAADGEAVRFRPATGGGGTGGMYLNTNAIGPHDVAAIDLDGATYDGLRLERVRVVQHGKLVDLDAVWADDGALIGRRGGTLFQGAQLVGSRWDLKLTRDGHPSQATLTIVAHEPGAPHRFTFAYEGKDVAPGMMCDADESGSRAAVAIADLAVDPATGAMTGRANTLYLACVSGAVGKATTWGYTPWALGVAGFEAAVRMVRADYCGDGTSWTKPGEAILIDDAWDVHAAVKGKYAVEALWGTEGALCLRTPRLAGLAADDVECGGAPLPVCGPTADLDGAALMRTRVSP